MKYWIRKHLKEEFEDTKRVIRIRKSKRNRQHKCMLFYLVTQYRASMFVLLRDSSEMIKINLSLNWKNLRFCTCRNVMKPDIGWDCIVLFISSESIKQQKHIWLQTLTHEIITLHIIWSNCYFIITDDLLKISLQQR